MKLFTVILTTALCACLFLSCSQPAAPTVAPTDVLKSQIEAQKKKDVATMKTNLSKASLQQIEDAAKTQNKTLDEALAVDVSGAAQSNFEFRNEKIEGDAATVEVKTTGTEDWEKFYFVKEDGRWKIDLDKWIKEIKKAEKEAEAAQNANTADTNSANAAPANSANTNSTNSGNSANSANTNSGNTNTKK